MDESQQHGAEADNHSDNVGRETSKEVLIRNSDMLPEEECAIIAITNAALEKFSTMKDAFQTQKYSKMAGHIKAEVDEKFGNGWFVICGKNYGTYVTHEKGTFLHFSFQDLHVTVFRAR